MLNYECQERPDYLAGVFAMRAKFDGDKVTVRMTAEMLDLMLFGAERDGKTELEVLARLRTIVEDAIADRAGIEGNHSSKTWKQIGSELDMPASTAHARYSSRFSRRK